MSRGAQATLSEPRRFCARCRSPLSDTLIYAEELRWKKRREIQDFIKYIYANVRRGSYVQIGSHTRKVVRVSKPRACLTLKKLNGSGETVLFVHDYYKRFKGIVQSRAGEV